MVEADEITNSLDFWRLIQKNPSRNISGITSVTVLTSPYPDGQKNMVQTRLFLLSK